MSKSDFTSTVSVSAVHAVLFDKQTKKQVEKDFLFPVAMDEEQAEKAVEKAVKGSTFRLAYVDKVNVTEKLYSLPIKTFTEKALKLSRRGEQGRTREPVITRTLESSAVHAVLFDKQTKKQVEKSFLFPVAMDEEQAEKAVEKAVKGSTFRLAYVDKVNVEQAVYEMKVALFVKLAIENEKRVKNND